MKPLIASFALTLAYALAIPHIPGFGYESWQIVALLNVFLAAILWFSYKPKITPEGRGQWLGRFLGVMVFAMALAIVSLSEQGESEVLYTTEDIILLCLIIPIAEEIIFRRTLYDWLSQKVPSFWGLYISAFLFALAHANLYQLQMPLGPFILGFFASWCYRVTGQLSSAIYLHSAANGLAILVSLYAPTWLEPLDWIYQKL